MNKKKLIFDIVLITGHEDIFELRFRENYIYVDFFLIFGNSESLEKIKKFYGVIDHKIKTFVVEESFTSETFDYDEISKLIIETTSNLYQTFEDLIFFSFSNEIPIIKDLEDFEIKSKEVLVFECDAYEVNFERKRKFKERGAVLTNFSHLIKNKKKFIEGFFKIKSTMVDSHVSVCNGYKIYNYNEGLTDLPSTYFCPISKKHIEYKIERTPRKFCFLFDEFPIEVDGDFIFKMKFENKFPESLEIDLKSSIQNLQIFLPNVKLYGEEHSFFEKEYKENEIVRVLSNFDCKDDDQIEIYHGEKDKKVLKYREIKNPS